MKKTVHKWFWIWEFEKEEKWLAKMSAQGWHLTSVGYCRYEFEQGTPNEYAVRLEMLNEQPSSAGSQQYIRFVEETGAEYIGHVLKWVYFRKKTSKGGFDLYSDIDSRIRHLKRILALLVPLCLFNGANAVNQLLQLASSGSSAFIFTAILCFGVTGLLLYGILRLSAMKKRLEKERLLHE